MAARAFLLGQRGGLGGVRRPADQAYRKCRTPYGRSGHRRRQQSGEDGRQRRHHFGQARTDPCRHAEQQPDDDADGRDREGDARRAQRSMAQPGQQVAAEGVRAQGVRGRGREQPGRRVHLQGITQQARHHQGEQGEGAHSGEQAEGAWAREGRRVQCGQGAVAQGGAEEGAAQGLDEQAGGDAEQDEGQRRGLQRRQVLGHGGVQGEPPEPRDVEDLLDRDRTADQGDDRGQQLREHPGQRAAQRVAGDEAGREPGGVPGPRPGFVEGGGQHRGEHPADHRPGRHTERERGQHHRRGPLPAAGREPAQPHPAHRGEQRGQQELRQRGENGGPGARPPLPQPSPRPEIQGAGAHQPGDRDGDHERAQHQRDGHPERGRHLGQHGLARHPGDAGVPARQPAQPVHEVRERALVQAELLTYGGQLRRRRILIGGAGPQDGQRGVGPGQPGQQ